MKDTLKRIAYLLSNSGIFSFSQCQEAWEELHTPSVCAVDQPQLSAMLDLCDNLCEIEIQCEEELQNHGYDSSMRLRMSLVKKHVQSFKEIEFSKVFQEIESL
jgi:hypothetical protein